MLERLVYVALIASAVILAGSRFFPLGGAKVSSPTDYITMTKGDLAPALGLITDAGDTVDAHTVGDSTLLVFFSATCPYCMASLPTYREIARTQCEVTLTFVMDEISTTYAEWLVENGLRSLGGCAELRIGRSDGRHRDFGVTATPTHYLIGPTGAVIAGESGQLSGVPQWIR